MNVQTSTGAARADQTGTSANPLHSSLSQEHFTPAIVVEAARTVLRSFDLDPASCTVANQTVKAGKIFTEQDDGLAHSWLGRVFCNPPGGKKKNRSLPKLFWEKLLDEWAMGNAVSAMFVGFSIELLQTAQRRCDGQPAGLSPLDFPFCVPQKRLAFTQEGNGQLLPGRSPTHGNVLIFVPDLLGHVPEQLACFRSTFCNLGKVVVPERLEDRLRQTLVRFEESGAAALR